MLTIRPARAITEPPGRNRWTVQLKSARSTRLQGWIKVVKSSDIMILVPIDLNDEAALLSEPSDVFKSPNNACIPYDYFWMDTP